MTADEFRAELLREQFGHVTREWRQHTQSVITLDELVTTNDRDAQVIDITTRRAAA